MNNSFRPPVRALSSMVRSTTTEAATFLVACVVVLYFALVRVYGSDVYALAASVQDDSFYYLFPAFNFSHASPWSFTFDGRHETYGFQPLYMVLLAVVGSVFKSIESFFRFAVLLGAILHCATAVTVFASVRLMLRDLARAPQSLLALLAALSYLLNTNIFLSSITVKENALAAFLLASSILLFIKLSQARDDAPGTLAGDAGSDLRRYGALLGLTLAALLLTRILPTTLFFVGVLLLLSLRQNRARLPLLLSFVVPLVLWGVYAYLEFGRVVPSSGMVKTRGLWDLIAAGGCNLLFEMAGWSATRIKHVVLFSLDLPSAFYLPHPDAGALREPAAGLLGSARMWGALLSLAGLGLLAALGRSMRQAGRPVFVLAVLLAGAFLGHVAMTVLLWRVKSELFYFTWYVYEVPLLIPLAIAAAIGSLVRAGERLLPPGAGGRVGRPLSLAVILCLGIAGVALAWQTYVRLEPLPARSDGDKFWPAVVLRSGVDLRSEIGDGLVGAFNAGHLAFGLGGRVVNLDGLANDSVIGRTGSWRDYFAREGIRYYCDVVDPAQFGLKYEPIRSYEIDHGLVNRQYCVRILD